jgi:hypothetical protein
MDTGWVRAIMAAKQSSPTIDSFFVVATKRLMALPDQKLGANISAYLLQIHPIHWTVFGNRRSKLEETWMPVFQQLVFSSLVASEKLNTDEDLQFRVKHHLDSTIPRGHKFPLYYTCHNDNAEGAANGFLSMGIRHSVPAVGVVKFLVYASEQLFKYEKECQHVDPLLQQFMPIGSRWYMEAASGANAALTLTRMETSHDDDTILIFEVTTSNGVHIVSIRPDGGMCDCVHFEMAPSLCRHLKLCAEKLGEQRDLTYWPEGKKEKWLCTMFPAFLVYQPIRDFFLPSRPAKCPLYGSWII